MSRLKDEFYTAVAAGFGGIWINSYEQQDVFLEITNVCVKHAWQMLLWDPVNGLQRSEIRTIENKPQVVFATTGKMEPAETLTYLMELNTNKEDDNQSVDNQTVLIFRNFTRFLATVEGKVESPGLLHLLQTAIEKGAADYKHIVVMSYDHITVPPEILKLIYPINQGPPDADERWTLAASVAADKLPGRKSPEAQQLMDASSGLGRQETLGAFGMSVAKFNKFDPSAIWDFKAKSLKKEGVLEVLQTNLPPEEEQISKRGFVSLGGMNVLKGFCRNMFRPENRDSRVRPRGILLLGPSGTGKTAFPIALGQEIGRQVIRLDIGRLMGGIIGSTESATRRAFAAIDAAAPMLLVIDEIEKALAGSGGSGDNDSGVGRRMLGAILTWLNDHTSEVFVIATANDIRNLPPELTRAERFDGIFFVDLPSAEQRSMIWDIYTEMYVKLGLSAEMVKVRPPDENWTPAEIKSCCRQARIHGISLVEAANFVPMVYKTNREAIDALQKWATDRTLSADFTGTYNPTGNKQLVTSIQAPGSQPQQRRRIIPSIPAIK